MCGLCCCGLSAKIKDCCCLKFTTAVVAFIREDVLGKDPCTVCKAAKSAGCVVLGVAVAVPVYIHDWIASHCIVNWIWSGIEKEKQHCGAGFHDFFCHYQTSWGHSEALAACAIMGSTLFLSTAIPVERRCLNCGPCDPGMDSERARDAWFTIMCCSAAAFFQGITGGLNHLPCRGGDWPSFILLVGVLLHPLHILLLYVCRR